MSNLLNVSIQSFEPQPGHGGLLLDGGAAVDRVGQLGRHTGVARLLLTRFRLRLLRLLLLLTLLLRLLTLLLSLLHAPTSRTGGGIKTKAEVAAGGGLVSRHGARNAGG